MNPKVSIIVTSYCPESKPYLDLCVESIKNLSYENIETVIVGRPDHLPEYKNCKTITPLEHEFWNGHGINFGVEHSTGDFLFIINDDVMLTKGCIEPLVASASLTPVGQVMPISNDQQGRYYIPWISKPEFETVRSHYGLMKQTIDRGSPFPCGGIFLADTLCLYAQMIAREKWERIGPMDDSSGLIDTDYSLRVRQTGLVNAIELGSLVYHFGGSSVMHTLDGPKRMKQKEQFQAKWGFCP